MGRPYIDPVRAFVLVCLLIPVGYLAGEGYITWILTSEWIFNLNNRDYLTAAFCILPSVLGHLATIWGHYCRSEREFQHSIDKVTTPATVKQKISLWEHHILWGYTVKYWILVGFVVTINVGWVATSVAPYAKELMENYDVEGGLGLIIGEASGYSAIACCGLILFLVLRRSMLHALGFTYAEILPLHRWLGVGILFWSVLHTVGYIMYYDWDGSLAEAINFYDEGRSTMNIMGFVALGALLILAVFSIPQVRRRFYTLFMTLHRIMTVIFLVATIVHYPYFMLWYYLLPSIILFYIDRFVPKIIQSRTLYPEASCTLNADADIIRMTFTSPEPMKPYYPGDYIMVQVPELGELFHPFTIASYWPEDPRSIVLFIRTYDTKRSWTGAMARLCGTEDKRIRIKATVDGVFGDRRHDYLKSEVLIVFVAGAAVTTFMALIKAIAAQIASSTEPLRMQFHLICTFRTRSELHAYGSFLHQITRDSRFTSWLHVEIYVSRPDKPKTLMGAHAHVIKNDILVPGQSATKSKKKRFQSLRRTGTKLRRALSGRTIVESPPPEHAAKTGVESKTSAVSSSADGKHGRSESIDTVVVANEKERRESRSVSLSSSSENYSSNLTPTTVTLPSSPISVSFGEVVNDTIEVHHRHEEPSSPLQTREMTYDSKRLPTFHDAQSASVSARLAKLDLTTSAIMVVIPLAFWYGLRAVKWEGSVHYCNVMEEMTPTQEKICYGTYAVAPVAGHIILMFIIGYFSNWFARKNLIRSLSAGNFNDIESGKHHQKSNLPYPDIDIEDEKLSVEDGNWDEGDVVYSTGRVNVKVVVERFMNSGVGAAGHDRALVTVFGGGPEAFVEHVERQIKTAKWAVDFHRETWAP
ncbi:ferric reductase like transmembrane component-domain-containing protein [Dissophora ornata]|nr:ferric reductase like transmembrane component-domain-containing protein [Dissophora ornata]